MLITKRTYKKKFVIGGAGIFDSIVNFFATMFSSNAAKQLASAALQARKTAAKDIGMANDTAYADADEVALTYNAIMQLFSPIEYHLSYQTV